jgi:hypothetical protein
MFVQTLVGPARLWFDNLPIGEIDSLDALLHKFSQHFSQQKRHTKDKNEILHIRRRDGKSLEDYITPYNRESLQLGGVGEDLTIAGFIQGVRSDDLIRCLTGRDGMLKTWAEIMVAANIFARTKKTISHNRQLEKKDIRKDQWKPSNNRRPQNNTWTRP